MPVDTIGLATPTGSPGERLRRLLARPGAVLMPGAHNGLAALQARSAGFEAVYLSGAAMSASMGLPDLGIITIDDVCFFIRQVARAGGVPVLVDGDTGHGEAFNVMYMVRAFEDAGAAAVHIEDQILPKKCGHLQDKKMASADEMVTRIRAAVQARREMLIIARTDAFESEGLEGAILRSRRYLDAGADAIFPEALTSEALFREFASRVDAPLLANLTEFGLTPAFTAAETEKMGYKMVIWPTSALRLAARAQMEAYATIRETGSTAPLVDRMLTRREMETTLGYAAYEDLDARLARGL
jgi:methylisocitrate lyase